MTSKTCKSYAEVLTGAKGNPYSYRDDFYLTLAVRQIPGTTRILCSTMAGKPWLPIDKTYSVRAIHTPKNSEQQASGAVVPPISLTSTFELDENNDIHKGFFYSRFGNPTRDVLEKCIASLDNAKYALCYPSGVCALAGVVHTLKVGDHIVCASDVYGGTVHQLSTVATQHGLEVSFYNISEPASLEKNIKKNTKLVWIESPTNPLGRIVDIRETAKTCKKYPGVKLAVDNTFLTSYFQKPLDLGADIVMYSLTKYMNGHADVIMGAVVTSDDALYEILKKQHIYLGTIASPFDCYLVSRGLKTLAIRMKQHMSNALQVAKFLQKHPLVEKVEYAGLPDHPQYELQKSQASGCGGLLSFYTKHGGIKEVIKCLSSMKYFINAGSLGGVESLASAPALVSHFAVPLEERLKIGITDNLIRLSVGIEEADELCNDLDQALWTAFADQVKTSVNIK